MRSNETYGGHYRALLQLGIPIVIGQVGMIVLGFADTLMIGHHSMNELAAASFVNNMFNIVIVLCTGFSYGLTPVVSSLFGRNEWGEAGAALKCSLLINLLVGLFLTVALLVLFFNVDRLGQPVELIPLIKPYFLTLLASIPFLALFNGFKQFTDGITDTKASMWILLGGNLLNIAGNWVLIYGKLGFPELGLLGAGLSTLLARIVMLLVFVWIFLRSERYAAYRDGFRTIALSRSTLRSLFGMGWPVSLQMGMETASFNLSTVMIGWLGAIALASHQVMLTISTLAFFVYYGVGAAIAIRVSNFHGQHDWQNVKRSAYAGLHIILTLALFYCVLLYSLRHHFGGWFTDSQEVSSMVAVLMIPMLLYQFGDSVQIAFANALRGIADVKPMMVIAFIAYFMISLPIGYLLGFVAGWGVFGVWMAFPFGLTSAGIMLWMRFRKRLKQHL